MLECGILDYCIGVRGVQHRSRKIFFSVPQIQPKSNFSSISVARSLRSQKRLSLAAHQREMLNCSFSSVWINSSNSHIHPKQMTQFSLFIASKLQFDSLRFPVAHSTVWTVTSIQSKWHNSVCSYSIQIAVWFVPFCSSSLPNSSNSDLYPHPRQRTLFSTLIWL